MSNKSPDREPSQGNKAATPRQVGVNQTLVLQRAVEILSKQGAISMEKLREHILDTQKRSDLADEIIAGGIDMGKQDLIDALKDQLEATEQILLQKQRFIETAAKIPPQPSLIGKLWSGTKGAVKSVSGNLLGNVVTLGLLGVAAFGVGWYFQDKVLEWYNQFLANLHGAGAQPGLDRSNEADLAGGRSIGRFGRGWNAPETDEIIVPPPSISNRNITPEMRNLPPRINTTTGGSMNTFGLPPR